LGTTDRADAAREWERPQGSSEVRMFLARHARVCSAPPRATRGPPMHNRIGVCSWSLQASSPRELVERVHACGLSAVQLALGPLRTGAWGLNETVTALRAGKVHLCSGMMAAEGEDYTSLESIRRTGGVRPDENWAATRARAAVAAELARDLGLDLVTLHAGFLPSGADDPEREKLVGRVRELVDVFADSGITVGLETGQETADTLLGVLSELRRPSVGVNFDPANMLLYGMGDPVDALTRLAPFVRQIHIKDALPSGAPDTWGSEVPVGTGAVDWARFFEVLREQEVDVDLLIEREAGEDRVGDITTARDLIRGFAPPPA